MTLWSTRKERQKAHKERIKQAKAILNKIKRARRKRKRKEKQLKQQLKQELINKLNI